MYLTTVASTQSLAMFRDALSGISNSPPKLMDIEIANR